MDSNKSYNKRVQSKIILFPTRSGSVNDPEGAERDFEKLSKAITEAVMKSEKVRKIVSELSAKDKVCLESFMVLVLSLQTLTDSLSPEKPDDMVEKKPLQRLKKKKTNNPSQYIDGNRLSKNEIEFQEFLNRDFDSDAWLRNNGLSF